MLEKFQTKIVSLFAAVSRQKLKVALISYYYQPPIISGVGVHSRALANSLAKNCEVHVFCSSSKSGTYKDSGVVIHKIRTTRLEQGSDFSKKRLQYFLFEADVVREFMKENAKRKFAIIHTQGSLTNAAFIIKKVCGIKWIHTFHAIERLRMEKLSKEEKQFEDLVFWLEASSNYSDGQIYVSRAIAKQGKTLYAERRSEIIPNGINLQIFKPSPIKKRNVLFVGRFSREKGIEFLPKIIEKVMDSEGATITVLCPFNSLPSDLKDVYEQIMLYQGENPERVKIITKPQRQEEIAKLYRDCQIYVQPSKYEAFGLCIAEAMATGRPIVSFDVGGVSTLVGDSGCVVKTKKEFLLKIAELLRSRDLCTKLGQKALARVGSFNWDEIAKRTEDYYRRILRS